MESRGPRNNIPRPSRGRGSRGRNNISFTDNYEINTPICPNTEEAFNVPRIDNLVGSYSNYDDETQPPTQFDDEEPPTPTGPSYENVGSSNQNVRKRTSKVWNYFTLHTEDGKNSQGEVIGIVRIATCQLCRERFILDRGRSGGTGTLSKHIAKKHGSGEDTSKQSTINPTTGGIFRYDHHRTRRELARYVPNQHQSFTFGEKDDFVRLVTTSFNPAYKKIPRSTLVYDIRKEFIDMETVLKCMLSSLSTRVCFTADSWTSRTRQNFVGITCHWIDTDWIMQKRIIAFQHVVVRQTSANIGAIITKVADEYGVGKKLLSFTFDNGRNFVGAIKMLESRFSEVFNQSIIHQRCICHVLQIVVKSGFPELDDLIDTVRSMLHLIRNRSDTKVTFKRACKSTGKKFKEIKVDMPTRWNTTHTMLQYALEYREALDRFCLCSNDASDYFISAEGWTKLQNLADFLLPFTEVTTLFSGCYYPTSHLVLPKLFTILQHMNNPNFLMDPVLQKKIELMKAKFQKYFLPVPQTYCIAQFFDPRYKYQWLLPTLTEIYEMLGAPNTLAGEQFQQVQNSISTKFDYYASLHCTYFPPTHTPQSIDDPYLSYMSSKYSNTQASSSSSFSSSTSNVNELNFYSYGSLEPPTQNFDILKWWKDHSHHYPILSCMAKDILTIPISSVASECSFSQGRKQLSEYRSKLTGRTLEMIVCSKDWQDAETRTQGLTSLEDDTEEMIQFHLSTSNETSETSDTETVDTLDGEDEVQYQDEDAGHDYY